MATLCQEFLLCVEFVVAPDMMCKTSIVQTYQTRMRRLTKQLTQLLPPATKTLEKYMLCMFAGFSLPCDL